MNYQLNTRKLSKARAKLTEGNGYETRQSSLSKVSKSPTVGQGNAVIYPSVLVAHKRKAINNVPKPQLIK